MTRKVIAAGHICLDVAPVFSHKCVQDISEVFRPGSIVQIGEAVFSTGGAVANTGLAMKIFGADVELIGKIGRDPFGDTVMKILSGYGAEQGMIVSSTDPTSYTIILTLPGIDRIFLHAPGADATFCSDDVPEAALEDAVLFHFGYPTAMRRMYQDGGSELIKLMKRVKEHGIAASLDLSAVDPSSEAGQQDWDAILRKVLPWTDFFVPSVEELCSMIDPERYKEWLQRAGRQDVCTVLDPERDIRPLAERCLSYGAKVLLLKCGAPGMYLRTAGAEVLSTIGSRLGFRTGEWADLEIFEPSYVPDRIVSGTGCGDTSIAAFLTAVLNEETPQEALHLAAAAGAACITGPDALSGLMNMTELKEKIHAGWKKTGGKRRE